MHRRSFALLLAGAAAALAGYSSTGRADSHELKKLTVDQVAAKIAAKDGKTFVFDDNSKDSWASGHVPTAKWLDDENVTADALPRDKATTLIFYCHNEA